MLWNVPLSLTGGVKSPSSSGSCSVPKPPHQKKSVDLEPEVKWKVKVNDLYLFSTLSKALYTALSHSHTQILMVMVAWIVATVAIVPTFLWMPSFWANHIGKRLWHKPKIRQRNNVSLLDREYLGIFQHELASVSVERKSFIKTLIQLRF